MVSKVAVPERKISRYSADLVETERAVSDVIFIPFRMAKFVQSIVAMKRTLSYSLKDMVCDKK